MGLVLGLLLAVVNGLFFWFWVSDASVVSDSPSSVYATAVVIEPSPAIQPPRLVTATPTP